MTRDVNCHLDGAAFDAEPDRFRADRSVPAPRRQVVRDPRFTVGGSVVDEPPARSRVHFFDLPVREDWYRLDEPGSVWACDRFPSLRLSWTVLRVRYARGLVLDYLPPMEVVAGAA